VAFVRQPHRGPEPGRVPPDIGGPGTNRSPRRHLRSTRPRYLPRPSFCLPLVVFGAFLLLTGCESALAPRAEADRHFTLYGVMNPLADSQGVIVFPVDGELKPLPDAPLEARLRSTNLDSGESVAWRDSIIASAAGPAHVFWAPFRASYGETYRLEVESLKDDGASSVTVKVPPRANIVPMDPVDGVWVTQDVLVTAPVDRLNFLLVRYVIKAKLPRSSLAYPVLLPGGKLGGDATLSDPPPGDSLIVQTLFVPIDYVEKAAVDASGWTIPINFTDDFREIRRRISGRGSPDATFGIQLLAVEISFVAANAEWAAPDDRFEADVLVQPGTMSNVERGFGFVGAGYRLEHSYTLPEEFLIRIGFRLPSN
jgi:hypothetical protein